MIGSSFYVRESVFDFLPVLEGESDVVLGVGRGVVNQPVPVVEGEFRPPVTQFLEGLDFFTELVAGHEVNDKAVKSAYSFAPDADEPTMVVELLRWYQAKVQEGLSAEPSGIQFCRNGPLVVQQ